MNPALYLVGTLLNRPYAIIRQEKSIGVPDSCPSAMLSRKFCKDSSVGNDTLRTSVNTAWHRERWATHDETSELIVARKATHDKTSDLIMAGKPSVCPVLQRSGESRIFSASEISPGRRATDCFVRCCTSVLTLSLKHSLAICC
jgi:hypothetical protein